MSTTNYPKISVIIPCYHTEKYIERCLNSIIHNTYRELEIICVNDSSGAKMAQKLEIFKQLDSRIVVVNNPMNIGLYHSRIEGAKRATGDYICFVDSDDYVENDFFRRLVFRAEADDADVTFSNICHVSKDDYYIFTDFNKEMIFPDDSANFFDAYVSSGGRYFRWHVIWDKLIKKSTWDKAFSEFERINERFMMCEDVVFSTGVLMNAKSISFVDDVFYFYCNNSESATSESKITKEKIVKNIDDIILAFSKTKRILNNHQMPYDQKLDFWRDTYINLWIERACDISNAAYCEIREIVGEKIKELNKVDLGVFMSHSTHTAKYDDRTTTIVDKIIKSDIVSFDIFDTLILRPFYKPTDLFLLLNDEFIKETGNLGIMNFSDIRIESEQRARKEIIKDNCDDITLDEIYERIRRRYKIDANILNKIKNREIELETEYCYARNFGKNIYELSRYLNKKIVITSDMYLPTSILEKILLNNNYSGYDKILVSGEYRRSKMSGRLYDTLSDIYKGKNICHIDDSLENCNNAQKRNIESIYLPKTLDAFNEYYGEIPSSFCDYNHDNEVFLKTTGVRMSIALIANTIFDNPFKPRDPQSNFNNCAFELGYYALGMNTLALGAWILRDSKRRSLDTLAFLSRDGYIPFRTTKIINENVLIYPELDIKYIYTSRRATMPVTLGEGIDFYSAATYLNWYWTTPKSVLRQLDDVIEIGKFSKSSFRKKFKFKIDERFPSYDAFLDFLEFVKSELYSPEKYEKYLKIAKEYYRKELHGKAGVFDIGYSAKPELVFSHLLDKNIVTYFIHANSSEAYERNRCAGNELELFYDFKPTVTGVLRELLYSSTDLSCIGYRKSNNTIEPVLGGGGHIDAYSQDVIASIQAGAEKFIRQYTNLFSKYFDSFDYNRYYMSIPLEYYLQYSFDNDRLMFKNLQFDDNEDKLFNILDFLKETEERYNRFYNLRRNDKKGAVGVIDLPLERRKRLLYYLLFSRGTIKKKFMNKFNDMAESPKKIRRFCYCVFKDHKRLLRAIKNRK